MRITSYNIRKAVGLDWRRDPDRICDVLAEIDADIVVLQEADKRVGPREGVLPLTRMRQELGYRLAEVAIRPLSHGWHGNAIFVRDTLTMLMTRRIDLPSVEPRGAVSAVLESPRLEVIGVHLGLNSGTRRRQLDVLDTHVRALHHPALIAGDFNEWRRGSDHVEDLGQVIEPGASFHASVPVAALDKFILCGELRPEAAYVHRTAASARASDHLPVVLDITVGEPA